MEGYLDYDGNPIQGKSVYVSPDDEIYILKKEGEKFIAENPFQKPREVTPEFAGLLKRIKLTEPLARFIISRLAGLVLD